MKKYKRDEKIRFIDMFGGIGGFRYGLEQASDMFECVWYCDIDKYAVQTYNKNFGENYESTDIREVKIEDIPEFDMLCAGFPCQAFSIAGKRRGFEDTRGTLFFEITRIIKSKRPKVLFLENVKGLLNHDKGETFRVIIQTLDELGYDLEWQMLNSKHFGVPQNRERVYIVGYLGEECGQKIFPIKKETEGTLITSHRIEGRTPSGISKQSDRMYSIRGVSPCLTSSFNKEVVNLSELGRNLTPVECERLQGFPDDWTKDVPENQRYKQLGNSVTTKVIEKIGREICDMYVKRGKC